MKNTIKLYYQLAKPGIIYGNSITAIAGFFLASKGIINWILFVEMLVGLALVMGAACVFNNYLDRDIDARMGRTKERATVTGQISSTNTLVYGSVLLIVGMLILYFFTNFITLSVALIGVVSYVCLYTPLKRKKIYSTLVGAIPGATPPVVGFCAVTHTFGLEAFILFLILFFWQMPHFYGIAMYRFEDYKSASVPLWPIKKGMLSTKIHIICYVVAFTVCATLLTFFGFTGYVYLAVVLILGLVWTWFGFQGFRKGTNDTLWGKKMFLFSLIVITVFSVVLSVNVFLR